MNTESDTFAVLCTVLKQALPSVGMANGCGYQTRKHSCSLRSSGQPDGHHPGAGTPRAAAPTTPPVPVRNDGARESRFMKNAEAYERLMRRRQPIRFGPDPRSAEYLVERAARLREWFKRAEWKVVAGKEGK